jgi:hypothetical protein
MVAAIARRFGASVRTPKVDPRRAQTLEGLAIENVVEGCVRETFGAVVALAHARCAQDSPIRAAMTRIADDEISHAALAWSVAEWIDGQLDTHARQRVSDAKRLAIEELRHASRHDPGPLLTAIAGAPRPGHVRRLLAELDRALWAA